MTGPSGKVMLMPESDNYNADIIMVSLDVREDSKSTDSKGKGLVEERERVRF